MEKKVIKKSKITDNTAELLEIAIAAALEKKAQNIISLNFSKLKNSICKYFIICNADSTTQVSAISDNIEDKILEKLNEKIWRRNGFENAFWIILDYGDVVIHIFQTEQRNFYRLEDLWADAEIKQHIEI
ncbi:MAG: ribosome silencing factor [Prevotellaceae bacterium]|jgi:ribosome-associated protein|nr:ribosome silencing factor [Prevotellaceae bacterium]